MTHFHSKISLCKCQSRSLVFPFRVTLNSIRYVNKPNGFGIRCKSVGGQWPSQPTVRFPFKTLTIVLLEALFELVLIY